MLQKKLFIKILTVALIVTVILGLSAVASGTNTSSDPLITLGYLTNTYKPGVLSDVNAALAAKQKQMSSDFSTQISSLSSSLTTPAAEPATNDYRTVTLSAGGAASVAAGGEVLFLSGTAKAGTASLTDVTTGSAVAAGGALSANHLYVASGDCEIQASGSAKLLIK